jgi:hypothetical protein
MKENKGRFKPGEHRSPSTEFKKGEHWREKKPFWDRDWLFNEYVTKERSASEIADDFGVGDNAILFWLKKYAIQTRSISEARKAKKWSVSRDKNGMFGRSKENNPNWRGGITPERQAFYSSLEWSDACKIVWDRDKGICQRCQNKKQKMHIHHIFPFSVVELRTDPENLVLLCSECHGFVHSKKNINLEFIKRVEERRCKK